MLLILFLIITHTYTHPLHDPFIQLPTAWTSSSEDVSGLNSSMLASKGIAIDKVIERSKTSALLCP